MRLNLSKGQRWFVLVLSALICVIWLSAIVENGPYDKTQLILPGLVLAAGIWLFIWGKPRELDGPEQEVAQEEPLPPSEAADPELPQGD
jgi:hypothetical protein